MSIRSWASITRPVASVADLDSRKSSARRLLHRLSIAQRPFIFMNAVGVRDDVRTMLHESGHAFHVFETQHLPYIQQLQVTMEFAEVASVAMELLAAPYLPEEYGGFYSAQDAALDRAEHLERIILFWPYMAMVDAFQHWAHTHPEGIDPAACDARWAELQNRFMPGIDWSGLKAEMMTGWHRIAHSYRAVLLRGVWLSAAERGAGGLAQRAARSGRVAGNLSPGFGVRGYQVIARAVSSRRREVRV
jgi:oligoendopeptidase F